jgi:hypothetical protein
MMINFIGGRNQNAQRKPQKYIMFCIHCIYIFIVLLSETDHVPLITWVN